MTTIGAAQEQVAEMSAPGAVPEVALVLRSTTDLEVLEPIVAAFVLLHPEIYVTYEQWGSNALFENSLEACAGRAPSADAVFSSGAHQMIDLVNRACAAAYRSEHTTALPRSRRWRDELWVITKEPAVIIYNTDLVRQEDAPKTRFALLDLMRNPNSVYDGKIATYDIEASGLGYLFAFMDSLEATTFGALLEGFARTHAVATCCSSEIITGVSQGKYLIAYNVLGSYVDSSNSKNIGVIHPEDYTLSDIPQVACRLTSRSPDFARWTSVFRPERRLRSRKLLEQGGSDREAAESWLRGGVFQRSGQTCPAVFVQFGSGSRSCA